MTVEITTEAELRELLGSPTPQVTAKERDRLHERDRHPGGVNASTGVPGGGAVSHARAAPAVTIQR